MSQDFISKNKQGWDLRTTVHVDSDFYDVEGFLKGKSTLNKPELELARDVKDKDLLHLQCHFGQDTMSWSRLGARCTGLDISAEAIHKAKDLNQQLGLNIRFIEEDVHKVGTLFDNEFDIVITSYGVLCWIHDLDIWAEGIARSLRKGGRFILVEFHPFLDITHDGKVSGHSSYFSSGDPVSGWTKGTYTDREANIEYFEYRWQNNISDVVTALIKAGLSIQAMKEYPYSPYRLFDGMEENEDGYWKFSANAQPCLYSLIAEKA